MKRNQAGFTLIEIAIVLVIIGLLLGGVLKGQELINSAKVKNLSADFKNTPVFIYGYQDKFKALPGDDANVATHVTGGTACTPAAAGLCAPGNGIIDGAWNATAITSESFVFWQHVRLAGLAPGPTDTTSADYLPKNTVGGTIGVTNAANTAITGVKGSYIICSDSIAGKFAKQMDTTLDDGNTAAGSLQVTAAGTATGGTAVVTGSIVDDTPYLVCMGI
ncbi:MAG: prepilin-type N-terminal cleavage/methylation domain-containing protein [Gallionellales bacterium RIFCSPLOWO2_02_60_31]|nr:MAG: prepilin-type N-terminal cleavage/methylation domain-containing protein [Gallionellales bacterium RIFCSPLOWO2_02_60_31]